MGLWLKKDGEFISVSGSSAGNGEVLTGDPDNPPEEWAVGQLLYDGVEDTGDGSAGGSIQYHSIGTSGVAGIEATEVDLPIVDVYGGPLVVGQKYAVSSEGSFRFGVGATSFVKQTVNINGSPAVECLAYKTFIDNERFMVSASRSWNCDDANPAVTVVASCSAGSMQTFNTGERRANVTFTPMQSSGDGGGDAGPHNHDEYALQTELADETAARIAGDNLDPYTVTEGTKGAWTGRAQLGKLGPFPIWQLSVTFFGASVTYAANEEIIKGFPAEALPHTPGTSLKFNLYNNAQDKQLPVYVALADDGSVAIKSQSAFTALDIRGSMTWITPDRSTFSAGDFRAMVDDWRSEARIEELEGA